ITGQHPFGHRVTLVQRAAGQVQIPLPRQLDPTIPPGLERICMRALAFEPLDRFRTMRQMGEALSDERFSNAWRESTNDLARIIRDVPPVQNRVETHI